MMAIFFFKKLKTITQKSNGEKDAKKLMFTSFEKEKPIFKPLTEFLNSL